MQKSPILPRRKGTVHYKHITETCKKDNFDRKAAQKIVLYLESCLYFEHETSCRTLLIETFEFHRNVALERAIGPSGKNWTFLCLVFLWISTVVLALNDHHHTLIGLVLFEKAHYTYPWITTRKREVTYWVVLEPKSFEKWFEAPNNFIENARKKLKLVLSTSSIILRDETLSLHESTETGKTLTEWSPWQTVICRRNNLLHVYISDKPKNWNAVHLEMFWPE